jgi:hypothetical protein
MRLFKVCLAVLIIMCVGGQFAAGGEKQAGQASAKDAGFEKLKGLSGKWKVSEDTGEHGMHGGTVSYKVTAGGSAVLETLFGGTEHEMVTMYFVDKDGLALTHYCILGNRPQMRAEPITSADKIVFKCRKGDNSAIEFEDHMHQVTFTFVDPNHLNTEWVLYKDGKPDSTHAFRLVRMK